jgi:hypothetical protein
MLKIIEPRLTSCFRALGETNGFRGKVWDSLWVRLKRRPVLEPDRTSPWGGLPTCGMISLVSSLSTCYTNIQFLRPLNRVHI